MLAIIDYDAGNLRSVVRAVEHAGGSPAVVQDRAALARASAVILPGVGSAAQAMDRLERSGLADALREVGARGVPLLGVCLGLQLLLEHSEEGGPHGTRCLGILPGTVRRFPAGQKVPHMGWNAVAQHGESPLWDGIANDSFFYFVHSYYADAPAATVAGVAEYSVHFCAALAQGSLLATQFHPEKSGANGLRIYANFLRWAGRCS